MADLMFVDSNNIGYASQMTTKLTVGTRQVQAVFGYLRSLRKILGENPSAQPLSLWDGKAQWRFDIYPEYKGNRNKDDKMALEKEAYEDQRPEIIRALSLLGVKQITYKTGEADDLAGYFSKRATETGNRVILVSGDKDWVQLVEENVLWTDPIRNRSCNAGSFTEFTGLGTPEQFLQQKALMGDTSDNIKGVGGIGEGTALELLERYESVENFLKMAKAGELPKKLPATHKRLASNEPFIYRGKEYPGMQDSYNRNMKIMDLRNVEKPDPESLIIQRGQFDRNGFAEFCEEFAFASILRDLDNWLLPFEKRAA